MMSARTSTPPASTISSPPPETLMPRIRLPLILLVVAVVLFALGPSLVSYLTDYLWFAEIGYQQVFLRMFSAQAQLFVIVFAAGAVWLAINVRVALHSVGDSRPVFTTREGIQLALPGRKQLKSIGL